MLYLKSMSSPKSSSQRSLRENTRKPFSVSSSDTQPARSSTSEFEQHVSCEVAMLISTPVVAVRAVIT